MNAGFEFCILDFVNDRIGFPDIGKIAAS